ncbi:MAG: helix-turn-helix transcriptional regulator [Bacteroidetes bacterium]|nr:helix-turn-helix transcriptional regulator [Bacteroidota bacterium]
MSVLRLDKKRTLEALAHDTGISIASMSRLENGKEEITISKPNAIADSLNVSIAVFFEGINQV